MTEEKPVWGRWVLIALVVGWAVWSFLGARTPDKPFGMALGQDLKGGTTLRFHLDLEGAREQKILDPRESDAQVVGDTLKLLEKRINKFGLAEVNLTPLGENRFEISVPAEIDADGIQKVVEALGELQFRIEVRPSYPAPDADRLSGTQTRFKVWDGAEGGTPPEKFEDSADGFTKFKEREIARWKEAREKAEKYAPLDKRYRLVPTFRGENAAPPSKPEDFVVLEEPQRPEERLGGEILSNIKGGPDEHGNPAVHFEVKVEYHRNFKEWTTRNVGLPMAIVLNGLFDQAPTINGPLEDNVQVTLGGGGGFGPGAAQQHKVLLERQQNLIATLQSGSLRVTPRFEAKSRVGPTLAGEAVRRGVLSTLLAFALVLLYMAIYYFGAGLIADLALFLNLVLIVGAMAFLRSTLTLPGIAGVVLTLGMAVDANILIYERIREEQARGRTVAQAVSEGFGRAFTTIVDSNVTTFLTAAALYVFGTGSIQGFAVTLSLGLLASMFTAVYVTRACFELWIRAGVKRIRMLGTAKVPSIPWMKLRGRFIPVSVAVMAVSLGLFVASKDQTVYDIDFTGGMKVQARFNDATTIDAVKSALDQGSQEVRIAKAGAPAGSGEVRIVHAGPYGGAEVVAVRSEGRWVEARHPLSPDRGPDNLSDSDQLDAFRAYFEQVLKTRLIPSWVVAKPAPYKSASDTDPWKAWDGKLHLTIAVEDPKNVLTVDLMEKAFARMPLYDTIEGGKRAALPASRAVREVKVKDAGRAEGGDAKLYEIVWKSKRASDSAEIENVADALTVDLREFLSGSAFKDVLRSNGISAADAGDVVLADPFPVNDLVGAGVARRMRNDAMIALLASFAAIILYVAFRFRSYAMGFASVLCLVHDVTIALGAVCLADHLGFVDAKINMGLVAAFLTLVGYSVNDTVVTFDRIRELRGKAPHITGKMIDGAINQTLARTVRTSVTVFLTLVVLFAVNLGARSMLEGLAYTLLVGVVVGTYSSIGIASPLLLFLPWFWTKVKAKRPRAWAALWPTKKPLGLVLLGACVVTAVAATVVTGSLWMGVFFGLIAAPMLATAGLWTLWAVAFAAYAFVAGCILIVPWSFHEDPDAAADEARRGSGGAAPPPPELPPTPVGAAKKGGGASGAKTAPA